MIELTVDAMTCGHCEKIVKQTVQKLDPQARVDLGCGQSGAGGILHGFGHVEDQPLYLRVCGVRYRVRDPAQDRVAHAGNLQNSHGASMGV